MRHLSGEFADPRGSERGAVAIGWFTRVVVLLAIVGVIGYDLVAVAVAKVGVSDDAQAALQAAVGAYHDHPDVQTAYLAALAVTNEHHEELPPGSFIVAPDGTITLEVIRPITTLVFGRFPPTKHWSSSAVDTESGHYVG